MIKLCQWRFKHWTLFLHWINLIGKLYVFEQAESIDSGSNVSSRVWICIASRCQSQSDILCIFQTRKCGWSFWPYQNIRYMKVCMQCCPPVCGCVSWYLSARLKLTTGPRILSHLYRLSSWLWREIIFLKKPLSGNYVAEYHNYI